jgi:hypothetical protein
MIANRSHWRREKYWRTKRPEHRLSHTARTPRVPDGRTLYFDLQANTLTEGCRLQHGLFSHRTVSIRIAKMKAE